MKYIANIITKSKIDAGDYINVVKDINNADLTVPTLIIGWANVKEIYPDVNILEKQITSTVSWTYSNREKRQDYEPDLANFIRKSFERLSTDIPYTFYNVLTNTLTRNKDLLKYINSDTIKTIYVEEKNLYIYNGNMVLGVSLSDLEFCGIKKEKIINKLKRNKFNKLVFNDTFLGWKIKRAIGDNKKIIPFLYSLKEIS